MRSNLRRARLGPFTGNVQRSNFVRILVIRTILSLSVLLGGRDFRHGHPGGGRGRRHGRAFFDRRDAEWKRRVRSTVPGADWRNRRRRLVVHLAWPFWVA